MSDKKETFCCPTMEDAIGCGMVSQVMTSIERSVVMWDKDEPWDISFCPFCGADLREPVDVVA